jgi:outer membrane protein assembly factor BamA
LFSCYTSRLKEGEYLLDKNNIEINTKEIDADNLQTVLKQRPNKKILGMLKFHLLLHNIPDSTKVENKRYKKLVRKNNRRIKRNVKKLKKGKDTLQHKQLADITTFGYKLLYSIGESPVLVDSNEVNKASKQLHLYLIRKGFFNNTVKDSVHYLDKGFLGIKRKRAKVYYTINVEAPYRVANYNIESKDEQVLNLIKTIKEDSKIKVGDVFDIDKISTERVRIADFLLNKGYYRFSKNYIDFYIDSTIGSNEVSIKMNVNLAKNKLSGKDSVYSSNHEKFYIKTVEVKYIQDIESKDTLSFEFMGVDYFVQGKNDIKVGLFHRTLHLMPGDLYSKVKEQQTFRDFTSYGLFKTVNIKSQIDRSGGNNLKLIITLKENKKQQTRIDGNGTNSGSSFGLEGSFSYNHKNTFRGAEIFKIGVTGKLESQPLLVDNNTSNSTNLPVNGSFTNISNTFNTIEFGPEVSLTIPKLMFIKTKKYSNVHHANTKISASLNYQRRINVNVLDYERGIQEVTFGYSWNVRDRISHLLEPLSFSAIEVNKSQDFSDRISSINDKLLAASFQNHIISATRYRFVYNELSVKKKSKTSFYYSGNFESSGSFLRNIFQMSGQEVDSITDSYSILGIRFSQYFKTSHDIRMYNVLNDKNTFVFRLQGGVGIPLANTKDGLPFEKSFFAGGTDKLRAWKARSLGPGSFRDSVLNFDKIGEILIEGNVEYRFDLLGFLDGALFIDAGNTWLITPDSLRPGSDFKIDNFVTEIAIGAGFGIRVDLDFFLLRFDLAFPLKNPSLIKGERWFYEPKDEYNTYLNTLVNPQNVPNLYRPQFNIGIGFPF